MTRKSFLGVFSGLVGGSWLFGKGDDLQSTGLDKTDFPQLDQMWVRLRGIKSRLKEFGPAGSWTRVESGKLTYPIGATDRCRFCPVWGGPVWEIDRVDLPLVACEYLEARRELDKLRLDVYSVSDMDCDTRLSFLAAVGMVKFAHTDPTYEKLLDTFLRPHAETPQDKLYAKNGLPIPRSSQYLHEDQDAVKLVPQDDARPLDVKMAEFFAEIDRPRYEEYRRHGT